MKYGFSSQCYRATSTKTRIETAHRDIQIAKAESGYRATSTKTRIETTSSTCSRAFSKRYRATSTKTRIETLTLQALHSSIEVTGRHPLKQGLKLSAAAPPTFFVPVTGRHPLKQGLKLVCNRKIREVSWHVTGRHPLKQGLKLAEFIA